MTYKRTTIAALALHEGCSDKAIIPIPLFTHSRRKRSFQRPTTLESCMDAFRRCAKFFCPSSHAFALTEALEKNTVSFVSSLLSRGGPSTVLRGVIPVCVDSVNRRPDRPHPHISKKVREFSPARTHRDAPPSIGSKVFVVCVEAPSEHVGPRFILSSGSTTVRVCRMPVSMVGLTGSFALQAATRLRVPVTKLAGVHNQFRPTVAAAKPCGSPTYVVRLCNSLKSIKSLFGKVDEIRHSGFLLCGGVA